METILPPPSAKSPAAEVWALMRTLFGQQRRKFLIAASELDLHPAQAGALLQLASPLPMHELAARLACDNSNVTGLIDRLETRGLVTRKASSDDRRVKHIVLTDAGRMEIDTLVLCAGVHSGKFTARLGDAVPLEAERGYHVMLAAHGRDAMDRLCDQCPDLIVLDLNMRS